MLAQSRRDSLSPQNPQIQQKGWRFDYITSFPVLISVPSRREHIGISQVTEAPNTRRHGQAVLITHQLSFNHLLSLFASETAPDNQTQPNPHLGNSLDKGLATPHSSLLSLQRNLPPQSKHWSLFSQLSQQAPKQFHRLTRDKGCPSGQALPLIYS